MLKIRIRVIKIEFDKLKKCVKKRCIHIFFLDEWFIEKYFTVPKNFRFIIENISSYEFLNEL